MKKKISECIKVLIKVADFESIEIAKYAETEIEYSTKEEMIQKEDELTLELTNNIVRNMRKIPEILGKKTTAVEKFEDSVKKTVPEWLKSNPVPNLANPSVKMDKASNQPSKHTKNDRDDLFASNNKKTPDKEEDGLFADF